MGPASGWASTPVDPIMLPLVLGGMVACVLVFIGR
jgi:hypothetical protein